MKLHDDFIIHIPSNIFNSGWRIKIYKNKDECFIETTDYLLCAPKLERPFNLFLQKNEFIITDKIIGGIWFNSMPFHEKSIYDLKNELYIIVARFIQSEYYFLK